MARFNTEALDTVIRNVVTGYGTAQVGIIAAYVLALHDERNPTVARASMVAASTVTLNRALFEIGDRLAPLLKDVYPADAEPAEAFAEVRTAIIARQAGRNLIDEFLPYLKGELGKAARKAAKEAEFSAKVEAAAATEIAANGGDKADTIKRQTAARLRRSEADAKKLATAKLYGEAQVKAGDQEGLVELIDHFTDLLARNGDLTRLRTILENVGAKVWAIEAARGAALLKAA